VWGGIITRWLSSWRRASTSVVSREIVATGILPSKPSAALRICGSGSRISARSLPSGTSGRGGEKHVAEGGVAESTETQAQEW